MAADEDETAKAEEERVNEDEPTESAGEAEKSDDENEKTRFLEATFGEIKSKKDELLRKKEELQAELAGIHEKLKITKEQERHLVNNLKELQRIETKLEDALNEEEILSRKEEVTEEELRMVQKKLGKIKRLYETLQPVEET